MRIGVIFLIGLLHFSSCKKEEDRNCIKSIGELSSKEILLENFSQIFMGPHLRYKLVQDGVNKVVITGGKNLLNEIEATIENQKLTIENLNKCAFLRSYDEEVEVEIHFTDLSEIHFEGSREVVCADTLEFTNFKLSIREGAGAFNLILNANSLNIVVATAWGNFNVSGNVNFANIQVSSNGFGNTNGLHVMNELVVVSNTAGKVEVNADQCDLLAETNSSGSIFYKGVPNLIQFNNYGSGQLVDNN